MSAVVHKLSLLLLVVQVNEKTRTTYSLSDTVFAKAELQCDGRVCIWLGVCNQEWPFS